MRQVIIYPGEDGYFVAEVPSLLGCNIAALQDDNISVPEEHFDVLVAVV